MKPWEREFKNGNVQHIVDLLQASGEQENLVFQEYACQHLYMLYDAPLKEKIELYKKFDMDFVAPNKQDWAECFTKEVSAFLEYSNLVNEHIVDKQKFKNMLSRKNDKGENFWFRLLRKTMVTVYNVKTLEKIFDNLVQIYPEGRLEKNNDGKNLHEMILYNKKAIENALGYQRGRLLLDGQSFLEDYFYTIEKKIFMENLQNSLPTKTYKKQPKI